MSLLPGYELTLQDFTDGVVQEMLSLRVKNILITLQSTVFENFTPNRILDCLVARNTTFVNLTGFDITAADDRQEDWSKSMSIIGLNSYADSYVVSSMSEIKRIKYHWHPWIGNRNAGPNNEICYCFVVVDACCYYFSPYS